MAIFNTSPPAYQAFGAGRNAVTNSATQIYSSTSVTVGSTTYTFPTGSVLHDITIINTGTVTCYLGSSSVTSSTGLPLAPGQQATIQGTVTAATAGVLGWNIYAITASGTTTTQASLATVAVVD